MGEPLMGIVDQLMNSLFGEEAVSAPKEDIWEHDALASLLPYVSYDPEQRFYHNDATVSFLLEIDPQVATASVAANVHATLMQSCPIHGGFQVINWTSPNVDAPLSRWAKAHVFGDDITEEMVSSRIKFMEDRRFGTEEAIKAIPHNRRVFVSGWIDGVGLSQSALHDLSSFRRGLLSAFGEPQDSSVHPNEFLPLIKEMLCAQEWGQFGVGVYDDTRELKQQIPSASISVHPSHMQIVSDPMLSVSCATVAKYPNEWWSDMSHMLGGDPDRKSDRPHGPVLSTLTALSIPPQKSEADLLKKRTQGEHSKKTGFAKFVTGFDEKMDELGSLVGQIENGERIFSTVYTVAAFTKGDQVEAQDAGTELAKIFRRVGIPLRHEKFLQLPLLLSALPMGATKKGLSKLSALNRTRLLKGAAVAALSPWYGEFKGSSSGKGMLLTGKQGQVFSWTPFESSGNYNVAVVGRSGAGKSVFMQELVSSVISNGGRALVIDDGYSFKTMCDIVGGKHLSFDGSQPQKLNPFSLLNADQMDQPEYVNDAVGLLAGVIACMGALGAQVDGRVIGVEEDFIKQAILQVWDAKGTSGEITDVHAILEAQSETEPRLVDLCRKISNFCVDGSYGHYFTGPANISVERELTVVEMSDIKGSGDLEAVVLQLVMFLGTELMYKTDRSVPVVILIDEAWDMLKGGNTADFIGGVVRRARKYTGSLVTGTQSIEDYYNNPAAQVCLENSDWNAFLAQKPETIDKLIANQKLSVDPSMAKRLKAITTVPGLFAEVSIRGAEGTWFFGRLMLDPFSLAVFSSKGSTVVALKKRVESGMTTVQALRDLVATGDVS